MFSNLLKSLTVYGQRLIGKKSAEKRSKRRIQVEPEVLEQREVLTVTNTWFSGLTFVVLADSSATSVAVRQSGSSVVISEEGTSRTWTYSSSQVNQVEFQGGAGNDRFVNYISTMPIRAFGFGGNDYLEGYSAADYMDGGAGNDILKGYGGNDILFGGTGDDTLLGMAGDDQLVGGDGNDHLNGREGKDSMWGQNGDDVLISIDGGTTDYVEGGAGRDTLWVDQNGSVKDQVFGAIAEDKVQYVASFANSADRTLDGDRLADPTLANAGEVYKSFSNNPLFSQSGPSPTDIRQGAIGDCWLLAGVSAVAKDSPHTLKQNVVDFDDGTYGVRLGNKFYRVDNDLAVANSSSTTPAYAKLGASNSMWVAVIEKAFAYYRTGANSYKSIDGGWSVEVNRALGAPSAGEKEISSYSNAAALANDIATRFTNRESVTIGFLSARVTGGTTGVPLIMKHMYTVMSIIRNSAGAVSQIVLRNPWGYDGAGSDSNTSDGLVTVTPSQLFGLNGRVNWGRV